MGEDGAAGSSGIPRVTANWRRAWRSVFRVSRRGQLVPGSTQSQRRVRLGARGSGDPMWARFALLALGVCSRSHVCRKAADALASLHAQLGILQGLGGTRLHSACSECFSPHHNMHHRVACSEGRAPRSTTSSQRKVRQASVRCCSSGPGSQGMLEGHAPPGGAVQAVRMLMEPQPLCVYHLCLEMVYGCWYCSKFIGPFGGQ